MPVALSQQGVCQTEGCLIVPEADIAGEQVLGQSVQKNDGNLIIQDMCLEKAKLMVYADCGKGKGYGVTLSSRIMRNGKPVHTRKISGSAIT